MTATCVSFGELAASLCWKREAGILVLVGYFDESGHPEDPRSPFFTIAGGVARLEQWIDLERRWRAVLESEGIQATHMNALARGRKPFHDPKVWPLKRRERVVLACIEAANKSLKRWLSIGFSAKLQPQRLRTQAAYVNCFRQLLEALLKRAVGYYNGPIELVLAEHPEVPAERLAGYYEVWRQASPRLQGFSVKRVKDVPQLQLADMVAYLKAEEVRRPADQIPFLTNLMSGRLEAEIKLYRNIPL